MRLLFIMNPASGRTNTKDLLSPYIAQLATEQGFQYSILYTTGKEDDRAIQESIRSFSPDRIAACGGDGTVQLAARNLIDVGIPLGILPLGSANGLATALGIPKDYEQATDLFIRSKRIIPVDLLKINDTFLCTHLSDIGTNALLIKNYEEAGDKGMLGYAKHLISSIQQSDLMHYEIVTPEGKYRKEGYMLAIANAHKYGTGVQISRGSVSDGKFEVCNVQKIDLESAIKAGLTAINVFIDEDMFSDVISCTEADIRINRKAHLQIDGEYIGEVDHIKATIITGAIQVLIHDGEV